MRLGNYITCGLVLIVPIVSMWRLVSTFHRVNKLEMLLTEHLNRSHTQNEFYKKLGIHGVQVWTRAKDLNSLYLENGNELKAEFLVRTIGGSNIFKDLENEHRQSNLLRPLLHDLFVHNDLIFTEFVMLAKSMLDQKIYIGKYDQLFRTGKYEVWVNGTALNYNFEGNYVIALKDTMSVQLNMLKLNFKSAEIDTLVLKEQWITGKSVQ